MKTPSEIISGNTESEEEQQATHAALTEQPVPLRERKLPDTGTPRVSICCLAFNHEHFIRDTLEGFLDQRTTFPVEILVHDDASTDQTAEIIRHYAEQFPHLIKPVFQTENKYSAGIEVSAYNTDRAVGGYLAFCEGDDYWTDPLKLQKQYRFLEDHADYVACFGNYTRFNVPSGERLNIDIRSGNSDDENGYTFSLEEMKDRWLTKTLTAMVRRASAENFDPSVYRYYRDIHFFYHLLKQGKAYLFYDNFGVFRVHPGGINSMKQGSVNANAAYNCYRELYLINRDEFTRAMYFKSIVSLFNYNLFNRYPGNTLLSNLRLLSGMFRTFKGIGEFRMIVYSLVKRQVKDYIKYQLQ